MQYKKRILKESNLTDSVGLQMFKYNSFFVSYLKINDWIKKNNFEKLRTEKYFN